MVKHILPDSAIWIYDLNENDFSSSKFGNAEEVLYVR